MRTANGSGVHTFWESLTGEIKPRFPGLSEVDWHGRVAVARQAQRETYYESSPRVLEGPVFGRPWTLYAIAPTLFLRSERCVILDSFFRGSPVGAETGRHLPAFYVGPPPGVMKRSLTLHQRVVRVAVRDLGRAAVAHLGDLGASRGGVAAASEPEVVEKLRAGALPSFFRRWEQLHTDRGLRCGTSAVGGLAGWFVLQLGTDPQFPSVEVSSELGRLAKALESIEKAFGAPPPSEIPFTMVESTEGDPTLGRFCPRCHRFSYATAIHDRSGLPLNERTVCCKAVLWGQKSDR